MPRLYPMTVRRQIVARLRSGEPVAVVAAETGVCQARLLPLSSLAEFAANLPAEVEVLAEQLINRDGAQKTPAALKDSPITGYIFSP
jgi:hypothetical protein